MSPMYHFDISTVLLWSAMYRSSYHYLGHYLYHFGHHLVHYLDSSPLHVLFLPYRQADLDKNGLITNWEFYLTLDPNNEGTSNTF